MNQGQKRAVDTVEGTVLVIAGPGTGKTEVLAARIAQILRTTDSSPATILCLTYTDAGTVAMRSRLLEFIGPDAYRVDIFTFHAFCAMVIRDNADHFGMTGLSAVSELEQYQLVQRIIDEFPLDHPLTRSTGDLYFEAHRLLELYGIMKQEDWSAAWLAERADHWTASLADDPDYRYKRAGKGRDGTPYKKGDLNQGKMQEAIRRAEQLKAAAATFDRYRELLRELGRYDFADMILWCIDAFKQSPELLAQYQERYLYLLVDEFQDTSGSQFELLTLLTGYWDNPNLFAVGDDDQSIYRFQGASVENIRLFCERFSPDLVTIALTENHRSSQSILDAAASLISRNSERLVEDKELVAMNPEVASLAERPELLACATQAQETAYIAGEIERLRDSGVPLERIAVIYRNHGQSEDIIRYLTARGIPVLTRRRSDILREPLIEKLLDLLRYLRMELFRPHSGERLLFALLHEPWFGIRPLTLARMSVGIARRRSERQPVFWREQLAACAAPGVQETLFDDQNRALAEAGRMIEELVQDAAVMPLQELLHAIITRLGVLAQALSAPERVWNLQILNTFFDFVREESTKRPMGPSDLLEMVDAMTAQGIQLPAEKLTHAGQGVNFVTAHGSKGLQFDYLFMIGSTAGAWDSTGRSRTYPLPPTVWRTVAGSEEEEARRLFYVAMTRARRKLVISWPLADNKDRALEKSRFVAELAESGFCTERRIELDDADLLAFGAVALKALPLHGSSDFIDRGFVETLLQKYSLSVTHLSGYLHCPVAFYFNTLLRVPAPMNAAMTFGSAVHHALEQLFRGMLKQQPRRFPPVEQFVEQFRWYMHHHQESFSQAEFRRRLEYGEAILPGFYRHHLSGWSTEVLVEYPCRSVVMDGIPLNGKLDKVELNGRRVTVVDYKTGSHQNARKKLKPPDPEKVAKAAAEGKAASFEDRLGGDYWRQAVFYRILAESDPVRGWRLQEARFDFVEPDKQTGEFHHALVEVDDAALDVVKEQIRDVYGRIRAMEFSPGCGEPDCAWCRFVDRYTAVDSGGTV